MRSKIFKLLLPSFVVAVIFASCKKEKSCEECLTSPSVENRSPVAIAGFDQVITLPKDSILLDGSASTDPDGMITGWSWKKISGPVSSVIINPSVSKTSVKSLVAGIYLFELTVTDNKGASAKDTMLLTVDATTFTNHPPIANAGGDQSIILPTSTVDLDGIGSTDPDNNITSYLWTKISGPSSFVMANPNGVQIQVTNLEEGIYEFELKVTDMAGLISRDTAKITVVAVTGTEIIFTNQVLINLCYQPDIPGACWINGDSPSYGINIGDTANLLPNSSASISEVRIKMDTSGVWELVPATCWQYPAPYPQSNFTYCIAQGTLWISSWFFSGINLTGRKADVKIRF